MKNIKQILFAFMAIAASSVTAQHDVSTNFLGFLATNYSLAYEYGIAEDMGARIELSVFNTNLEITGQDEELRDYDWTGLRITPEYRFYFNSDRGTDGLFAAPYLRYRQRTAEGDIAIYDEETEAYVEESFKRDAVAFGLGINVGKKWTTDRGFFFEPSFGIGRFVSNNVSYDNQRVEDYLNEEEEAIDVNILLDWRLGLNVGWRFGG